MRSLNFIIPITSVSNAHMEKVYRILLKPITAFQMHTYNYFIEFYYTQYHQPFESPAQ